MAVLVLTLIALAQFMLAVVAPARLVQLVLLTGAIPLIWTVELLRTPLGPMNAVAIQLCGLCIALLAVMGAHSHRVLGYIAEYRWHLLFASFCAISIVYAPSPAFGVRTLARLLGPLLFLIVVMIAIERRDQIEAMGRAVIGCGLIVCALAYVTQALGIRADDTGYGGGVTGLGPPGMGPPVFAAHMIAVSMLAAASFIVQRRTVWLVLTILFAVSLVATLQRTSTAAMLLGFSTILFFGTRGVARFSLPIAGVLAIPALLIVNEDFRRRMFFKAMDPRDIIADPVAAFDGLDSSGRFTLWGEVMRNFFEPNPIAGAGLGATQSFLHARFGFGVVHSEYVRLLCEVGIIGLVLFLVAIAVYFCRMIPRARDRAADPLQRTFALAAIGGLVGYLCYMATDNSLDYVNQFGNYVFGFVALSLKASELSAEIVRTHEPRPTLPVLSGPIPNLMR